MNECIFCKIIAKEIPSHMVWEGADVVAFLDIRPSQIGHTLVVPREHVADYLDASPDIIARTAQESQKIARAAVDAVAADGFNLMVNTKPAAGQVIFHMHWHIIPRFVNDGLRHWPPKTYAAGEAEAIAEKMREALRR